MLNKFILKGGAFERWLSVSRWSQDETLNGPTLPAGRAALLARQGLGARPESEGENEVGDDDRNSLKENGLEGSVAEIRDDQHLRVDETGGLRQGPLEPREERRIVEGPFGSVLRVPEHEETVRHLTPLREYWGVMFKNWLTPLIKVGHA